LLPPPPRTGEPRVVRGCFDRRPVLPDHPVPLCPPDCHTARRLPAIAERPQWRDDARLSPSSGPKSPYDALISYAAAGQEPATGMPWWGPHPLVRGRTHTKLSRHAATHTAASPAHGGSGSEPHAPERATPIAAAAPQPPKAVELLGAPPQTRGGPANTAKPRTARSIFNRSASAFRDRFGHCVDCDQLTAVRTTAAAAKTSHTSEILRSSRQPAADPQ
jgi:hypothetical protein